VPKFYIVNRYRFNDESRGTNWKDSVLVYSEAELIELGATPEEAREIYLFMHRDRMRQQRLWRNLHGTYDKPGKERPDNKRKWDVPKAEEIAAVDFLSPWRLAFSEIPKGCKHIKPKKSTDGNSDNIKWMK